MTPKTQTNSKTVTEYQDLGSAVCEFLRLHGLVETYLKNLRPDQQCIGCTRDKGDHDGECPLVDSSFHGIALSNWDGTKQLDSFIKYYLKDPQNPN